VSTAPLSLASSSVRRRRRASTVQRQPPRDAGMLPSRLSATSCSALPQHRTSRRLRRATHRNAAAVDVPSGRASIGANPVDCSGVVDRLAAAPEAAVRRRCIDGLVLREVLALNAVRPGAGSPRLSRPAVGLKGKASSWLDSPATLELWSLDLHSPPMPQQTCERPQAARLNSPIQD
jgi:hypothetical protein